MTTWGEPSKCQCPPDRDCAGTGLRVFMVKQVLTASLHNPAHRTALVLLELSAGHQTETECIYLSEPATKHTLQWLFSTRTKQRSTGAVSLSGPLASRWSSLTRNSGDQWGSELLPYRERTWPWGVQGNSHGKGSVFCPMMHF